MPLEIVRNDLTKMNVDVIVNPTNQNMYGTAGVDGSIHSAAGPELKKATERLAPLEPGHVEITKAYNIPSRYIIHTVGPIWKGGNNGEAEILGSCYQQALELAAKKGFESIAFPLIASGTYGYPKDKALTLAISTISKFLLLHEMTVYLVVFDKTAYQLSEKLFSSIKTYINDNYVEETKKASRSFSRRDSVNRIDHYVMESSMMELKENFKPKKRKLEDVIGNVEESFSKMLLRLIDERDLKDPVVYKGANVTKQTFSKIRNNTDYTPKKNTAIAFAISLELSMDETKDLLQKAGYALTHSSKADLIISYFIDEDNYDIHLINTTLFEFGFTPLGM